MKTFAVILTMKDPEKNEKYRSDHIDYVQQVKTEGKIAAMGRFTDGAGGLIIYKGDSLEEVTRYVENDPIVKSGARDYEIHEWEAAKWGFHF